MDDALDPTCQEIKELFVNSKGEINNKSFGFDKIIEQLPNHSRSTISIHLKEHLLKTGFISRDFDRKYKWNSSRQVNYTPIIHHISTRYVITISSKFSPSSLTTTFSNNLDEPLTSYQHYWYPPGKNMSWEKLNPKIILKTKNKEYPLCDKYHKPHFFIENPNYYNFRMDFPFPIYKNQEATIEWHRNNYYELRKGSAIMRIGTPTQKIEFILNCPTPNYHLNVFEINDETGKAKDSKISPTKNGKKIMWKHDSHNLEFYYLFEWQEIKSI